MSLLIKPQVSVIYDMETIMQQILSNLFYALGFGFLIAFCIREKFIFHSELYKLFSKDIQLSPYSMELSILMLISLGLGTLVKWI